MTYGHFIAYNVIGGVLWVALFTFGGYFFGNLKFVQDNFSLVVLAIIFISVCRVWSSSSRSASAARGAQSVEARTSLGPSPHPNPSPLPMLGEERFFHGRAYML